MRISRRDFLQAAGAALLIGGSVPLLSGCSGLKRIDIKQKDVAVTGLKQDELNILELASLAPSGHNTQPWGIRAIEPYTWIVMSDEQRWLPAVDPDHRETILSIGAFMENLVVAAGCYGYDIDLKLLAKTSNDKEIGSSPDLKLSLLQ
ncbi:MAG: twin-arginine translocation signal domain-containing protein [Desulfobacteraceae bacterium]|nr:twin-arginine translocation signal domain-containing protein [Desulfobacteraceae bacterium]